MLIDFRVLKVSVTRIARPSDDPKKIKWPGGQNIDSFANKVITSKTLNVCRWLEVSIQSTVSY